MKEINQNFYTNMPKHFHQAIRQHCPDLLSSGERFFLYDNVRPRTAVSVQEYLAKDHISTLLHSPYSYTLSQCNFFLFPHVK